MLCKNCSNLFIGIVFLLLCRALHNLYMELSSEESDLDFPGAGIVFTIMHLLLWPLVGIGAGAPFYIICLIICFIFIQIKG